MASLLIQRLYEWAERRGETIAVAEVHDGRVMRAMTWRALRNAAARWAATLREGGEQHVVMLACPNRLEYMVVFLGTMLADGVVFSIPPATSGHELRRAIAASGASMVVGLAPAIAAADDVVQTVALDSIALDGEDELAARVAASHRGTGSLLLQSSGTTGLPKIIRRTAAALDAVGVNCRDAVGMTANDRLLAAIPICHSYAIDHAVMAAMIAGAPIDLYARFDPDDLIVTAAARGATIFPGVPFMFDMLARCGGEVRPPFRRVYSAGGLLPRAVWDAFHRRFGMNIGQIYGSSEFASVTWNDPDDPAPDPLSGGRPMSGVEVRIVDRERPLIDHPLPAGAEGQVAVAAPSMFSEYVGPDEPVRAGAFLLSGDLGRLDAQGRLYITGRLKLLIDVGGQKVNPIEVEATLKEHPDVADAIVVPVPVSDTVYRVKAVIQWHRGEGDIDALRQFARERLSPHKVPRYYEVRSSLPRSSTGKVLRHMVVSS